MNVCHCSQCRLVSLTLTQSSRMHYVFIKKTSIRIETITDVTMLLRGCPLGNITRLACPSVCPSV